MGDGIYCALSGALAQQTALETIAENLANASTNGYRKETPVFREVLNRAGGEGPLRFAAVEGTALAGERGAIRTTGRDLDVALPDGVFIAVQTDAGERYTRAGSLRMQPDGTLVTSSGHTVLSEASKPLTVSPSSAPVLTANGEVVSDNEIAGRLKLVSFPEPTWLAHEGGTLLAATERSGAAAPTSAELVPGAVEESNASPITAMTEMMSATRMFEAVQRAIETFNDIDRRVATTTPV